MAEAISRPTTVATNGAIVPGPSLAQGPVQRKAGPILPTKPSAPPTSTSWRPQIVQLAPGNGKEEKKDKEKKKKSETPVTPEQRQALFQHYRAKATAKATEMLKQRKSLRKILDYLAAMRHKAAVKQDDPDKERFGTLRQPNPVAKQYDDPNKLIADRPTEKDRMISTGALGAKTPLIKQNGTDIYPGEPDKVNNRMQTLSEAPSSGLIVAHRVNDDRSSQVVGYQTQSPGGIRLTATILITDSDAERPALYHTAGHNVEAGFKEAEAYHEELYRKDATTESRIAALAKTTWLITNVMPYQRGSAAVAEWYNLAVVSAFKLPIGDRKGNLDLIAFRTPIDSYAANYKTLYEHVEPSPRYKKIDGDKEAYARLVFEMPKCKLKEEAHESLKLGDSFLNGARKKGPGADTEDLNAAEKWFNDSLDKVLEERRQRERNSRWPG